MPNFREQTQFTLVFLRKKYRKVVGWVIDIKKPLCPHCLASTVTVDNVDGGEFHQVFFMSCLACGDKFTHLIRWEGWEK